MESCFSRSIRYDLWISLYADEKINNKGFGLNLINTLSKQLKAQINYPKENYFKIELDFSVKNIQVQIAE